MGSDLHLLIVEDSLDDTKLLLRELSHGGFDPTWERVETESALTDALNRQAWDLVIADFTMPGFSGRQALTVLRARDADLPFIFVSGTIGEEVAVEAMKAGAHDFIMKGNLSRLVPAIERELQDAAARREHRRAAARVQHLAYYDVLTDLPNRALLYDRLGQGLAAAQREHTSLAFLMMDLDGFKEINDTLGHRVGDLLLQQVGQRLQGALREVDTIARLGGDEFAVVLPGADADTVTLLTDLILGAVQQPFRAEGRTLDVRASLGVALYPTHGTTPDLLMQRADAAMYVA
jgi:diguanylate cyclase (GGDEF)-like protein